MEQWYTLRTNLLWGLIITLAFVLDCGSVDAQVSGIVFRDFNLNGMRSDTLPIENGVAGVTVRAFVDLSKIPLTTVTDITGKYTFNSTDAPAGQTVRIEFDNLPTGYYNGPAGSGSHTSVQFAKAPATDVNVGINYPSDFCQTTNIRLVVPCYVNGNVMMTVDADGNVVPDEKQSGKADALISIDYKANGVKNAGNFPADHLATAGQVGAIWSVTFQRRSKAVFSGAVVKRHMSFGPLGPGGIYKTELATQTTTPFLDVKTIGIDVGNDPHSGLFGDKTQASDDPGPMQAMGRLSFGGMDFSEDDKTLYFINLKDRRLYSVFVDSPARVPTAQDVKSWAIPDPGCSNGDFRPWALKIYHGKLYIGVVCSAETSQQQSDLRGTVYRVDPTATNPIFENILSFPIDFRRGPVDSTVDPAHPENSCLKYDHWLPWTDSWPTPCGLGDNPIFVMHPQPILSSLAFDDDGSLIIGFFDRFGHLAGVANHDPQGNGFYDGFTGGDLLRAYNNNGVFELEKNGKAGNLTGSGVGNNEGPVDENNVGGEFYGKDNWFFIDHYGHNEVTNGALMVIPGYNEVITSAFDPLENVFKAGGLKVFSNKNGEVNRDFVIYSNAIGSFGKASGLGEVKALCNTAPVEIGNRIWFDDNRDGIQDAYEPGIDGIVLTLHDMEDNGNQVGTQTTHDGGQYYFNNSTVPGGLKFYHRYEIRMDTTQLPLLDITLAGARQLTPAGGRLAARNAGGRLAADPIRYYSLSPYHRGNLVDPGLRDSDGQLVGSSAVISVTTLDVGQNDFTYDLSIYSCPKLSTEEATISLCPGASLDSLVVTTEYFSRVDSVRYLLFTSPQSGTAMYSNEGIVLGTVKPDANNRAALYNLPIRASSATAGQLYVYATVYPIPENPACRQSTGTVLTIKPRVAASATGGTLTCSIKQVSLAAEARYQDGSAAQTALYAWAGPNGFVSTDQNPAVTESGMYTVTVSTVDCPNAFTTATAQVLSNTESPVMTASIQAKTCPSCKAIISATTNKANAIITWTGPNGFFATGVTESVFDPGEYTITAKGDNGCEVAAKALVLDFVCPVVSCVPLKVNRRIR